MLTLVGLGIQCTDSGQLPTAPFQIPPTGRPEVFETLVRYEAPSALAFDSRNRPYMFATRDPESYGYLLTLRDGQWVKRSFLGELRKAIPEMRIPDKRFFHSLGSLFIDDDDAIYATVPVWGEDDWPSKYALVYSSDGGEHFSVYPLPGRKAFMEIRTGNNAKGTTPALATLTLRKKHPAEWGNYYILHVYLPKKQGDGLVLGEGIKVTEDCFGIANHSGGYSFAATAEGKTHFVYGEIPDQERTANPTYVATIDRADRKVEEKVLLTRAWPEVTDVHSTPVITMDSEGYLHVLSGAHGNPFLYARSQKPHDISGGWTIPKAMHRKQTYASLVCDANDRLHSVYRIHPQLLYQHKPAKEGEWSEPVVLANPPEGHEGYSIYYHRLFLDRKDNLYLSFSFYEMHTKDEGVYPRVLAVSRDHGQTWTVASTRLFQTLSD